MVYSSKWTTEYFSYKEIVCLTLAFWESRNQEKGLKFIRECNPRRHLWGTRGAKKGRRASQYKVLPSSLLLCAIACLIPQCCPLRWINSISSQSIQRRKGEGFPMDLISHWLRFHPTGSPFHTLQAWMWLCGTQQVLWWPCLGIRQKPWTDAKQRQHRTVGETGAGRDPERM